MLPWRVATHTAAVLGAQGRAVAQLNGQRSARRLVAIQDECAACDQTSRPRLNNNNNLNMYAFCA